MTQNADYVVTLERAQQDAIDLLDEMIPYVPQYFSDKWEFAQRLERIRGALARNARSEADGGLQ